MNHKEPKVSILLPIGKSTYLIHVLHDILDQTFQDWELVALVDSNAKQIKGLLRALIPNHKLVIVEFENAFNLSQRLNCGILKAAGEYIARFDADDRYLPSRLLHQVNFLREPINKSVAVVGSWCDVINSDSKIVGTISYPLDSKSIRKKLMYRNSLLHPSILMRREVCQIFKYNESVSMAQDFDLWLRISRVWEIANIGEKLFSYRIHQSNHSSKKASFHELFVITQGRMRLAMSTPSLFFHFTIGSSLWLVKNLFFAPTSRYFFKSK